jgi:hypothetical protein
MKEAGEKFVRSSLESGGHSRGWKFNREERFTNGERAELAFFDTNLLIYAGEGLARKADGPRWICGV